MGLSFPCKSTWNNTAPTPIWDASHCTKNGREKSACTSTGADVSAFFNASNAAIASPPSENRPPDRFFKASVSGAAKVAKSLINRLYHPAVPKKARTSFTDLGTCMRCIACTRSGSVRSTPPPTINPSYSLQVLQVRIKITREDYQIVQIYFNVGPQFIRYDLVHQPAQPLSGVTQPERHHAELVQRSPWYRKRSAPSTGLLQLHLPKRKFQVHTGNIIRLIDSR
ncbi:uncharacterized protein LOC115630025 [Scaptodrosophila lebanonensis]|uniref:Uncharacterized protein LOC115630025 n=1 Tax=Drosophila lebanonensis TaxID=7225 RepID=A0A6J2U1G5_DROLE|nr:uncharacterized protein LOC115630025 [Scaptodrosophila lebanonensis]